MLAGLLPASAGKEPQTAEAPAAEAMNPSMYRHSSRCQPGTSSGCHGWRCLLVSRTKRVAHQSFVSSIVLSVRKHPRHTVRLAPFNLILLARIRDQVAFSLP